MRIDNAYYEKYKRDSKPEGPVGPEELEMIRKLLFETLDLFMEDYQNSLFKTYTPFTTRTGVDIKNVDDAIQFVPYHEGLHGGAIMALKRFVKAPMVF